MMLFNLIFKKHELKLLMINLAFKIIRTKRKSVENQKPWILVSLSVYIHSYLENRFKHLFSHCNNINNQFDITCTDRGLYTGSYHRSREEEEHEPTQSHLLGVWWSWSNVWSGVRISGQSNARKVIFCTFKHVEWTLDQGFPNCVPRKIHDLYL